MAPRPKLSRYNSWMFSREFEAVELMHRECLRWYRLLLATFEHSTTTSLYHTYWNMLDRQSLSLPSAACLCLPHSFLAPSLYHHLFLTCTSMCIPILYPPLYIFSNIHHVHCGLIINQHWTCVGDWSFALGRHYGFLKRVICICLLWTWNAGVIKLIDCCLWCHHKNMPFTLHSLLDDRCAWGLFTHFFPLLSSLLSATLLLHLCASLKSQCMWHTTVCPDQLCVGRFNKQPLLIELF